MLRLKEEPREWIKFTAVIGFAVNVVLWLLWWKERMPVVISAGAAGLAILAVVTAMIRPHWFRGFYRKGMTVSFYIGQTVGKVLLTVFFFLLVTPLGLALRLAGKDLLHLKRGRADDTWWHEARNSKDFDRMF